MACSEMDHALATLVKSCNVILLASFGVALAILAQKYDVFDIAEFLRFQLQDPPKPKQTRKSPPILTAADHVSDGKHHLLLAATGSVATIKIPSMINALAKHRNLSIRVVLTPSAAEFLRGQAEEQPSLAKIATLPNVDGVYLDADEWSLPWKRGASILHIELRRWADLMVIAPVSATALAKLATGIADSLVYSVARAWDTTGAIDVPRPGISWPYRDIDGQRKKGIVVAPAMNTAMWHHPATAKHMAVLEGEWNVKNGGWVEVLRPVEKGLACGDAGSGGMKEWAEIVKVIEEKMGLGVGGAVEEFVKV